MPLDEGRGGGAVRTYTRVRVHAAEKSTPIFRQIHRAVLAYNHIPAVEKQILSGASRSRDPVRPIEEHHYPYLSRVPVQPIRNSATIQPTY